MNTILYEVNDNIAKITFNRPNALNAINKEMLNELDQVINEIKADDNIHFVLFTGVGKAFIAGADISEMAHMNTSEAKAYGKFGADVFRKIELLKKVTIATINGYCLGGGNELAMACDIRIASEKAKFGQPEVSLGITPGFSGTIRLPRIVGVSKAKELLFTGKMIDAKEALTIGLVSSVEPLESLNEKVHHLIHSINKNSLHAVLSTKQVVDEGIEGSLDDGIELETVHFSNCFSFYDQKEGMNAFIEKRKAKFNHNKEE
ncbi:enoyl-CoA hydratase/isomerase family protein [Mycoplasmatota bacterium]|nr:enoyl-CoA hydratase/isomerase family protein [Mycoplasmatota bacterium]